MIETQQFTETERQQIASRMVSAWVFANVTMLISPMWTGEWDTEEQRDWIQEAINETAKEGQCMHCEATTLVKDNGSGPECFQCSPAEIHEWYIVDDYLAAALKRKGHIVVEFHRFLHVWGREGTGQAIKLDDDIQEIALDCRRFHQPESNHRHLQMIDNLSATLETVMAHFPDRMPPTDVEQRSLLIAEAKDLLRDYGYDR